MIKLIAIDVDGTLLDSNHKISQMNKDWIKIATDKGAILVLASGRPLNGLFEIFNELELNPNNHYLMAFNGAVVVKASDHSLIFERTLELQLTKSILRHLEQFPVTPILSRKQELIVDDANGYNVQGEAIANQMELVVVDNLSDYLDYQPNKILVSADSSVIDQFSDAIQNPFLDSVDFVKSAPFYLEIIVKDTNKGSSLQYLSNLLGIDQTEVMAIGDNYNDVSMIEYAGLGVAMGQADEIIKRKSQYITDTNDENGVAKALREIFN
jgi:Cof subfamily protein (haloacid dehalogenase superfamily)